MKNDVALVTGGGRGIGRACALALAAEGAAVAVVARTKDQVDAVAAEIKGAGGRAAAFVCDVTDEVAVHAMARAVEEALGTVTILVNNAGIAESAPFLKTTHELWSRVMRTNVDSAFFVTQAVLPGMLERGRGRVVNVASIAAKQGHPYISAYCAAKHALLGLTRSLATEVATKGITVNAVCPGYVDTPMTERSVTNMSQKTGKSADDMRAYLASRSPQERIFTPEEVAEVVVRLASDGWRGVNGQSILLDGGAFQA